MAARLVLIASYPKSGNTWARLVLQGLLDPSRAGAINALDIGIYGSERRRAFDDFAPAPAADLLPDEIDLLLPSFYESVAEAAAGTVFLKVHDRAYRNSAREWVFPPGSVHAVLHLVRHPFDVAVSYAEHDGCPVERVIERMADPAFCLSSQTGSLHPPMRESVGGWSDHTKSWMDPAVPYRVLTVRYEDLHRDDVTGFTALAEAAGFSAGEIAERLRPAVEASRFERVRTLEQVAGFAESPGKDRAFFSVGHPGRWHGLLSVALRQRLVRDHGEVMQRLGYREDGSTVEAVRTPRPVS